MPAESEFDAVVIGAGPAGSACAQILANAGWRVALVEKTEFPRRKVCGEFLSAATLPILEACGIAKDYLDAAGPPVMRIGLYSGDAMIASKKPAVWGRALNRATLDTLLRDAAIKAGVDMHQPAEAVALAKTDKGHRVTLDDGTQLLARTVVAASGSWNARGPFQIAATPRPSDLFAFKAHFKGGRLPAGLMPLLAFPGGYGGLVESDSGLTSLSCCIRRDVLALARDRHGGKAADAVLAHIRATTQGVERALCAATLEGGFLSTGPIHPGIRKRQFAHGFVTGNLAGEAHPVIAEGIGMAIQASHLLARLLITCREEEYPAAWSRKFAPRLRAASLFAHLAMSDTTRTLLRPIISGFPAVLDWGARRSGKTASLA